MKMRKKSIDKEAARQLRTQLNDAINRGELNIQETVKRMRKISRLTQPEFANHRGVSVKVIKEIERGVANPTVNTLNKIGQFFGLEVAFVRSKRLLGLDSQTESAATNQEASIPSSLVSRSPIEDSRRLMEELENIKKLATPSKALQDELKRMETELRTLRNAVEQNDPHQTMRIPSTELTRATRGMDQFDTALKAVQNARKIIESAEQIQQQIQPPPALKKWLDDIDAAKARLAPLDPPFKA